MAIPSWSDLTRPILELLADGEPRHVRELVDPVGDKLDIPESERKELLPSGQQTRLTAATQLLLHGATPRRYLDAVGPEQPVATDRWWRSPM